MTSETKGGCLGILGSLVGLVATFVVAIAAGLVLHLDTSATRRVVADQVNAVLKDALEGRVHVEHIAGLGPSGVDGVRVRAHDPDGVEVLHADAVSVHIRLLTLARSLVERGPIVVDVPAAFVGHADVNVDGAPSGELRLARTFTPRPSEPSPTGPPGRAVRVDAADVRLGHAWVHGAPAGAPPIDADLSDLAGRAHVDGPVVRAELDHVRLVTRALPGGIDPRGSIGGKLAVPAANGEGIDVRAVFDGDVGGVPAIAEARLDDRRIDARIDLRDPTGSRASALARELTIHDPLTLHAEAHGTLPLVTLQARLGLGEATANADAELALDTPTRLKATLKARDIDLAALSERAPTSRLGLDARADIAIGNGVQGDASGSLLPGTIDRQATPPVDLQVILTGKSARARARIHDPTMPTELAIDVLPRAGNAHGRLLAASLRSHVPDLHRVPKLGATVGGSADIEASARALLPEQSFERATVQVFLKDLDTPLVDVGQVAMRAELSGRIARPVIDAEVHTSEIRTGELPLKSADVHSRIEVGAKSVRLRDVAIDAAGARGETIAASARLIELEGKNVRVDSSEIRGIGDPIRAQLAVDTNGMRANIDAPRIDLPRLTQWTGRKEVAASGGTLALRGEGEVRRGVARGHLHAELDGVSARSLKDGRGVLDAKIDDREVTVELDAGAGETGHLALHTDRLVIDGRANDPGAWRRAVGRVGLVAELDLERASSFVPVARLPIADVRGKLTVQGHVERNVEGTTPSIRFHAHTNGLIVAAPSGAPERLDGVEIAGPPRWRSSDLDFGADLRTDGFSGLTSVAFRATDEHGNVVALSAKAILPYAEMARHPPLARQRLLDAPMNVKVIVPPRRLDALPSILSVQRARGAVEAELELSGTARDPRLYLVARGRDIRTAGMPAGIDADTDATLVYDGRHADLSARVTADGAPLLVLDSQVDAKAVDIVNGLAPERRRPIAWSASGRVRASSFPLEVLPQLAERRIRGRASGDVSITGLHEDARVKGRVDLEGFAVDRATYPKGVLTLDAAGGRLAAGLRLDQTDGFIDLRASTGLHWGAAVTPHFDAGHPIEAKLVATGFRAAALQPFVESIIPKLDGRIDAEATARIVPGRPGAELGGELHFRDGTVQIAALGSDFGSVRADASFAPDGTVRVTNVFARGTQGELRAGAFARLDGTRIAEASADVRIPARQPLDLSVEGMPLGEISGAIKMRASQSVDKATTSVVVDVPRLAVALPRATKTGIQSLRRNENIRVGVYRDDRRFVRLPLYRGDRGGAPEEQAAEPTRIDVDVRLGKVTLSRGNQLGVTLSGSPKVVIEDGEPKLFGQISAERGWVDVQGKRFEIERGTVTFNGESPPDPTVLATAAWNAADGSRIYADFIGRLSTGRLTLRSEPPRPKNEILALILFGTADGANPTPPPPGRQASGTTRAAVGLGGAFVAEGLTEALDDLAGIQATARVDTTRANNPRPEVELQISPKVTLGFAHVIGTPPVTEPDKNLAMFDYRFHRNWSLQTVFGDRGTALVDTLWQKRY